jgi:hypothetical protein
MKCTTTMLMCLTTLAACGSGSSPAAPVISDFMMTSPLPPGATTANGSLHVTDPSGLGDLAATLTLSGGGVAHTLHIPIPGGTTGETSAVIPIVLELSTAIPPGAYQVEVTLNEGDATSNALSAPMVVPSGSGATTDAGSSSDSGSGTSAPGCYMTTGSECTWLGQPAGACDQGAPGSCPAASLAGCCVIGMGAYQTAACFYESAASSSAQAACAAEGGEWQTHSP